MVIVRQVEIASELHTVKNVQLHFWWQQLVIWVAARYGHYCVLCMQHDFDGEWRADT